VQFLVQSIAFLLFQSFSVLGLWKLKCSVLMAEQFDDTSLYAF